MTTVAKVASLASVKKAKMGANAKILRATSTENQVTLQEIAGCALLDKMRTQQGKLVINPMQETKQQVAM